MKLNGHFRNYHRGDAAIAPGAVPKWRLIMKHSVKTSAVGLLLLIEAISCSALTLGRARGAVVLGQPLDITVPVQTDEGEDISSLCLDADVFYGDVQQARGRITLTSAPPANGQSATVRIRSSQPVDEPVVAASLRAGCPQKVSRRFTFFADLPSESVLPPKMIPVLPGPAVTPAPAVNTAAVAALATRRPDTLPASTAVGNVKATKTSSARPVPAVKPVVAAAKVTPKLMLASIVPGDLRDPDLKFTNELFTLPVDNPKSAAAAIALWRALNAQPEDIMRDWQRLEALDTDVKALRVVTAKNESNLSEMKQRLQVAESERFANGLVYGLAGLLLASLAGLFLLWRRQGGEVSTSHSWWQGVGASPVPQQSGPGDIASTRATLSTSGELPTRTAFVDIDLDLSFADSAAVPVQPVPTLTDSQVIPLERVTSFSPPTNWSTDRGFSASMVSALRTTNSEEVVDVRQQADFFVSLGQYEQAIHTLMDRTEGADDASPLVYLDLMQLLHRLGRRVDFNQTRNKFNRLFTGRVPEYSAFDEKGQGLEGYPEVLAHISKEWSSDLILDILEGCIFRVPEDDLGQPFDLAAFEDLLMLHAIATRLASDSHKG